MRRSTRAAALLCALLAVAPAAMAHRIDEYLQATLLTVGKGQVEGSMRLIPGVMVSPMVLAAIDGNGDGIFSEEEEQVYAERVLGDLAIAVDGKSVQPRLKSWSFPQPDQLRDGLGEIHIVYSIGLSAGTGGDRTLTIENRHLEARSVYLVNVVAPDDGEAVILAQKRNERQSQYELDFRQGTAERPGRWERFREWGSGLELSSLFHLGMRHISDGTDHLLFLLTLLLPAPLVARGGRWAGRAETRACAMHLARIVTAFTLGHSLTLTLAAMDVVRVAERPVEVLIAVSILVSAVHALKPIFPGREAVVAGFFGLVHGLAFAATLDRLGLTRWDRLAGIFAFNLGIEAMQMCVVAAILPSLILMSRTRFYAALRIVGAGLAGVAALGWIVERILGINVRVDAAMNAMARHALGGAAALLGLSIMCRFWTREDRVERIRGIEGG